MRANSTPTIVMVMPVYNEVENIAPLVDSLSSAREKLAQHSLEVCFVDDNSPDGTGEEISSLAKNRPWIKLLSREDKNGLGEAYLAGFHHVLTNLNPDYIGQMDSDLSHDPKSIIGMEIKLNQILWEYK